MGVWLALECILLLLQKERCKHLFWLLPRWEAVLKVHKSWDSIYSFFFYLSLPFFPRAVTMSVYFFFSSPPFFPNCQGAVWVVFQFTRAVTTIYFISLLYTLPFFPRAVRNNVYFFPSPPFFPNCLLFSYPLEVMTSGT